MRLHHRAEPAHSVGYEGHIVTLWTAKTYWQAKLRLTHASIRQESIRLSLKSSFRSDVAGV